MNPGDPHQLMLPRLLIVTWGFSKLVAEVSWNSQHKQEKPMLMIKWQHPREADGGKKGAKGRERKTPGSLESKVRTDWEIDDHRKHSFCWRRAEQREQQGGRRTDDLQTKSSGPIKDPDPDPADQSGSKDA